MSRPLTDDSREHMEEWFRMGDTAEGLQQCREYLYRTAPSRLSSGGLMCVCQAARDAMRARDAEISRLRAELNEARQGVLVYAGGAS